jgi:nicotinate phosphoribosyltransferase
VALRDRRFWLASEEEIYNARTTDIYFRNAAEVLLRKGVNPRVVFELYVRRLPYPGSWGVVTGIYEVAKLLEGRPVTVRAMEEGELFVVNSGSAVYEPIVQVEGRYADFAVFENPMLGLLCYSSGVSTKAARIRVRAWGKTLLSFGSRRTHPALAPMVERSAFIGGFDAVSNVLAAELLGVKPVGTMPHAYIQCVGDQVKAWRWFDEVVDGDVPRVALVDTFYDEKTEAVMAWEALGERLYGVRIDTPSSRRGDWRRILEEVRWELDARGGDGVKIFVSGGVDEDEVEAVKDLVDGFGVGTSVSAAPVLDFSAKIVEVEAEGGVVYRAKRGDIGGKKMPYRAPGTLDDVVMLASKTPPRGREPLLTDLVVDGKIVRPFKSPQELRLKTLQKLELIVKGEQPRISWR